MKKQFETQRSIYMKTSNTTQIDNTFNQHRQVKHNQGQSLVEFGLVVGLIVIVMIGSFDIFNLLQQKADLDKMILQSARQAGEFGGVGQSGGDGENEIKAYIAKQLENMSYSQDYIDTTVATLVISVTELDGSGNFNSVSGQECQYGQFVTVNLQADWQTNLPLVLFFNGFDNVGRFNLTGTARCWRAL